MVTKFGPIAYTQLIPHGHSRRPLYRYSRRPHRHSRVSGNPDGTEKTRPLPPNHRRIPAYAGMTVGGRRSFLCYTIPYLTGRPPHPAGKPQP